MSFLNLLECNGCGARTAPFDTVIEAPGWRIFDLKPLASEPQRKAAPLAVCPACWQARPCAEVLGDTYAFLALAG